MKKLLTLLAFGALFTGVVHAEDAKPDAPQKSSEKGGDDLHSLMKKIGKDFGPLAKSVDDSSKVAANLKAVKELIELADKCAELAPASAEKVPEAKREKFIDGYKAEIAKLSKTFKKIEAALDKKNFAAAKSAVAEAGMLKKEDHPKYIKKN